METKMGGTTRYILMAVLLFAVALPTVRSQNRAQQSQPAGRNGAPVQSQSFRPQSTASGAYRLQSGDIVHVQVLNPGWEYLSGDLLVQPDHMVKLPTKPASEIMAAGLTLGQFEAATERAFARMIRNAALVITVKSVGMPTVYLLGAFAKDGPYPIQGQLRALDAIAEAGGAPNGDLSQVILSHGRTSRTLDLEHALRSGNGRDNVGLQANDVLYVPEMHRQVFILGAVNRPGPVLYHPGMTLLEALSGSNEVTGQSGSLLQGAGGPTEKANLYDAVLTRARGGSIPVDLDKLIREGQTSQNLILQPNDSLYVPESKRLVYVFGAVARPGGYVLRDRDKNRVLDALTMAGGPTQVAEISKARIAEAGTGGAVHTINIHLDRILRKGEMQYNVVLKPNDVLYLPERGAKEVTIGSVLNSLLYAVVPFIR